MKIIEKLKIKKDETKIEKLKVLGVTIYKKKSNNGKVKIKLLGIPVIKIKKTQVKIGTIKKIYLLGIPLVKSIKQGETKKVKLFGLKVFNKKVKKNKLKFYILGIKVWAKNKAYDGLSFCINSPNRFKFSKSKDPLVSIIIPVCNQYKYTKKCLYSILSFSDSRLYEVIVADDCSSDKTKKIEKYISGITVIHNKENLGYIKNCNNAAKYAKGKYLYFLNNETVVQKHWLKNLIDVLECRNDIGVIGAKILNNDASVRESGIYLFNNYICSKIAGDDRFQSRYNYLRECDCVSQYSLITRKDVFNKIGGFDSKLSSNGFCYDYCIATLIKGLKVYVQPKSIVMLQQKAIPDNELYKLIENDANILRKKWPSYFSSRTNYDENKDYSGDKRKPTMLVIDGWVPEFDKHAGGKTIFQFLELFVKMGLNVKFCSIFGSSNVEPYYSILTNNEIEIIKKEDVHEWIDKNIGYLDYILLSRPQVAEQFMIKALKCKGVKVLYYGHDLHHLRMQRENECLSNIDVDKIIKMEKVEKLSIAFSDIGLYPSIAEKQYVNDVFHLNNVDVIAPYLYNIDKMQEHCNFNESKDIIFVGSSHGPNLDGLLWFINKILPLVVKKIPNICLNIVGSHISEEIREIKSPNIKIVGYLSEDELNELYLRSKISIAPLRYGAGIKGKIIDSIYHSTPVITTTIGAEGIDNKYGLIKVALNEKDFADKLIKLYNNSKEWSKLLPLYAKFIQENYSFDVDEKIFKKYIDVNLLANK